MFMNFNSLFNLLYIHYLRVSNILIIFIIKHLEIADTDRWYILKPAKCICMKLASLFCLKYDYDAVKYLYPSPGI